ncbi:MAG: tetratricopeptide repeat protein [Acidobacteriaceae bacterium]|jgi:tetratricopeptide (TPR) repeat protein|nr:tetratricopeptide repeat protein [Acidobacteriaceae bacterium]
MNKRWFTTLLAAGALMCALPQLQTQVQAQKASGIHGHITNAAGFAMPGGDVKLTTDLTPSDLSSAKYKYTFPVDASGNYKGDADTGTYLAVFFKDGKTVDYISDVKIVIGVDTETNFDMTRKEFMDKMSPEDKKALEEYKKKMSSATAENAKISNINTLLAQARDAKKAGNFEAAAAAMQQAVTTKPEEGLLWFELGDAQAGLKKYDDAIANYQKAIDLDQASKKPKPDLQAAAYNNLGQAQANSGKSKEAAASYEAAAKILPANAGMYYSNEAATFFNHGDTDDSLLAADKAIAADPTRPDPYFVRGQSMIVKATVDEKSGKIVAPPGCAEAYQKYLDLAPEGPHAKDATDVLTSLGQTIHSTYKAGKKGK